VQNKQAEARKQYKVVTEVQVQNKTIADPEGIKKAAYEDPIITKSFKE